MRLVSENCLHLRFLFDQIQNVHLYAQVVIYLTIIHDLDLKLYLRDSQLVPIDHIHLIAFVDSIGMCKYTIIVLVFLSCCSNFAVTLFFSRLTELIL